MVVKGDSTFISHMYGGGGGLVVFIVAISLSLIYHESEYVILKMKIIEHNMS